MENVKSESLYEILRKTATNIPNCGGIYYKGRVFTYRSFLQNVDKMASILYNTLGVRENDVILVAQPNIPHMLFLIYALNKLGAIVNLVHPFTPYNQIRQIINKTNTKYAFLFEQRVAKEVTKYRDISSMVYVTRIEDFLPLGKRFIYHTFMNHRIRKKLGRFRGKFKGFNYVYQLKDRINKVPTNAKTDRDISVYLHSGSTTGEPKTICLCDNNFNTIVNQSESFYCTDLKSFKNKYFLSALPSFHGFGFCVTMHLAIGSMAGIALMPKFNADEVAKMMNNIKLCSIAGVPTIYEKLLKSVKFKTHPGLKHLASCWCGGDSINPKLGDEFNALLASKGSKGKVFVGYGLTEAVAVNCVNTIEHNKQGSIGWPMKGAQFKIVDEKDSELPINKIGEICIKSDAVMVKYLNDEAHTNEALRNGWLHTGDMGHIDEEGYIFFDQRQKRIIKVSGVMVFPSEVEKLIETIPGVSKACAIQIPDALMQHAVKVFVKAKYFDEEGMKSNIMDTCRKYLIKWSVPKEIEFVDELPVTMLGKIDFKKLQDQEDTKRGVAE